MSYTAADERADLAFLVGANYGRTTLAARVTAVLDDYAPTAKGQRGCPAVCGCTDCEMAEDLYALTAATNGDQA